MKPFSTCLRHVRVVLFGTALLLAFFAGFTGVFRRKTAGV